MGPQGGEMSARLQAAGDEADGGAVAPGEAAGGDRGDRGGAHAGDPARVHDRDRHAAFGVAQEDQAGDVGQAACLVAGHADPLQTGVGRLVHHTRAGQEQGLIGRVERQLRLHHGPALGLGGEHRLDRQLDVGQAEPAGYDVGVREIEDVLAQRHIAASLSMATSA
jgi:hypothetical protein